MAKKPFSKSFGFLHSFSTNFLVLYMVTGATPPDSWVGNKAPVSSAKPSLNHPLTHLLTTA